MIKKYITILFTGGLLAGNAVGQNFTYDSAVMGGGYTNQIYYDMANGEVGSATVSGWDIAHTTVQMDNCIRANHVTGMQVFHYRNGSDWSTFDTAGWTKWPKNYNDIHVRERGAFNLYMNPPWGFGWGTYNSVTHEVEGDSMYLLAWWNGTSYTRYRKFQPLKQTAGGDFIFRYADLDGSNEVQDTLLQSEAAKQNYKYYSFTTSNKSVREPEEQLWDISFTRYFEPIQAGPSIVYYLVMGVESNRLTKAAKIISPWDTLQIKDSTALLNSYKKSVTNDLTAIGSGWKYLDMSQNPPVWYLADTQSFIVKSVRNGDSLYWMIHFTGFTGGGSGKIYFMKTLLGRTNAIADPVIGQVRVFPNPAKENIYVSLENSKVQRASLKLYSLTGVEIRSANIENPGTFASYSLSLNGLAKGVYILSIESGKSKIAQQIIIE